MAGVGAVMRVRTSPSGLARQTTLFAVELFLPCVLAGAVVTLVLARFAQEAAWTLPGMWCVLFSLGLFASYRLLPRPIFLVALFYLVCGGVNLYWARGDAAFSPWAMAVPFGLGQWVTAAILYWKLERDDEPA
jgi:hypothetical protein